jgi:hypothetical protein
VFCYTYYSLVPHDVLMKTIERFWIGRASREGIRRLVRRFGARHAGRRARPPHCTHRPNPLTSVLPVCYQLPVNHSRPR